MEILTEKILFVIKRNVKPLCLLSQKSNVGIVVSLFLEDARMFAVVILICDSGYRGWNKRLSAWMDLLVHYITPPHSDPLLY